MVKFAIDKGNERAGNVRLPDKIANTALLTGSSAVCIFVSLNLRMLK